MTKRLITIVFIVFAIASTLRAEVVAPNGAQKLQYRTSWLGNSFGGIVDGKPCWVQQDIAAMHVCPDGTIYTNVSWEEAGGNCSMYKDGKMLGAAWHTHGWGYEGGKAVTANEKYVFIALRGENEGGGLVDPNTWPPKGFDWHGISRRLKSDFTKGAPFEHGKGGKGDTLPKSFLVINEVPLADRERGYITGLWADEKKLYVSNPYKNRVEIYDTETMQKLDEWDLTPHGFFDPAHIAPDKQGNLWIFHGKEKGAGRDLYGFCTISQFSPQGKLLDGHVIGIPEIIVRWEKETGGAVSYPIGNSLTGAFCFAPDNTMYVFDREFGLRVYPTEPDGRALGDKGSQKYKMLGTVDETQGYDDIPHMYPQGEFGDLRFGDTTVKALGCDAAGNLYIAQDFASTGGGAVLESYKILDTLKEPFYPEWEERVGISILDAKVNWRLFGLCFIDCAALDPEDETVGFTKDEKYKLDWSQTEPGKEWTLLATTFEKFESTKRQHPKDAAGVWIRNYRGHKIMFLNDMNNRWLRLCEFDTPAWRGDSPNYDDQIGFSNIRWCGEEFFTIEDIYADDPEETKPFFQVSFEQHADYGEGWERYPNIKFPPEPPAQGWWVDLDCGIWRATETQGIRYAPIDKEEERFDASSSPGSSYCDVRIFEHPKEFSQVKRIRYDAATDTLYLGGCATVDGVEHKNQHWKPMGPIVCRYDNFLKGDKPGQTEGKLRWRIVLPYVKGSKGHESCEPMGFDVAGDYLFVPYTGASKEAGFATGHVEVYRTDNAKAVGWMEPDPKTVGEVGLQDIRECLSAHRLKSGEYVVFLEDDYKAKVVIFRLELP